MAYYITFLLILPFLFSCVIMKLKHSDDYKYPVLAIFCSNIIMNIACLLTLQKSIINITSFSPLNIFVLAFGYLFCSLLSYEIYTWLGQKDIYIFKKTTFLIGILTTNVFVYFSWLLGETGRQSFDIFLYNLHTPVNSEVANFDSQMSALLIFMLIMSVCFMLLFRKNGIFLAYRDKKQKKDKKHLCTAITILLCCILILCSYPFYTFHLEQAYAYYTAEQNLVELHYVDPDEVTLTWPQEKRNLIYIFMESFESSSFSKELGGLNEDNLLPNFTQRMSEGVSFSNHQDTFGGAISMPQTTVTLSGMITSLSGVNNQVPAELSEDDTYAVIPYMTTLPDLLKEQGYQSSFTIGMSVDAYHIGPFYRAHGVPKTAGWEEKVADGTISEDYKVWWGFEDKKLYEFAKEDVS